MERHVTARSGYARYGRQGDVRCRAAGFCKVRQAWNGKDRFAAV